MTNKIESILIVDDTPENIDILVEILKDKYQTQVANSGERALKLVARGFMPDLVLLDIMMPGIDGFNVCRCMKNDERLRETPVIFISAMSEVDDKIAGFDAGGVDYITKPFQWAEVEARVATHLNIRRLQRTLEKRNQQIQQDYQRLRDLESLREDLSNMIIHDIRNLLSPLKMTLDMLALQGDRISESKKAGMLVRATACCNRMLDMSTDLIDISRLEEDEMPIKREVVVLAELVRESVMMINHISSETNLSLELADGNETGLSIIGDPDLIRRVVLNLLANAIKFSPTKEDVEVRLSADSDSIQCSIADKGPGIPPKYHGMIFSKYGQTALKKEREVHSSGLGLAFCRLVIEAHGGAIGVRSVVDEGSTFWFRLPLPDRERHDAY